MRRKYLFRILIFVSVFLNGRLYAQFQPTGGPSGGGVQFYDMIEWQGSWYAAANDFLIRSEDQGNSWEVVDVGLPTLSIQPRAFADFDGYLYVSTNSEYRMMRSNDNGATWQQVNGNLPTFFGIPIFLAREMIVNNGRLIALPFGTDPVQFIEEGASNWNAGDYSGIGGNGMAHINGDTLYASIGSSAKLSVDNGATWTDFPGNPPVFFGGVGITDFLRVGNRVIVSTSAGGNNGIFYSDDSLQTWTAPSTNFFSGNAGMDKLLYLADDNILALSGSGIMKTTDQGETWSEVTTDSTRPAGLTVFIKRLSNDRIAVGSTSGLYLYDDLGEGAFTEVDPGIGRADIYQTKLFKGEIVTLHDGFISAYSPEESRWQRLIDIRDIGIRVFFDIRDYISLYTLDDKLILLGENKAYQSSDGVEYEEMTIPDGLIPVAFHAHSDRWFMVTGVPGGFNNWVGGSVYYSDDAGEAWTEASVPDFPTLSSWNPTFFSHSLVVANGNLFLVGSDRILRSADNGESWTVLQPNTGVRFRMMEFDDALFLSSDETKIHRSTDNGDSWQEWYDGLPNTNAFSRRIHGLVRIGDRLITYNDPSGFVEPGAQEKGFFELTSGSGNWSFDSELEALPFKPSGLLSLNGYILAYWPDIGFWISQQLTATSVQESPGVLPSGFQLEQNYPNPFNPSTNISFKLPKAAVAEIRIFNALGQQVRSITPGRLDAGNHVIQFEAGTLASGLYFYQLNADGLTVQTRMMTLIK